MDKKLLIENTIAKIDRNATDRQREAGELYLRTISGDQKAKHQLQEGISTSDIPALLAPAINVQFLAQYAAFPTVWQEIVGDTIESPTLGNIQFGSFDFDTNSLLGDHDGDTYTGMGMPGVGEYGEYPALSFTTAQLAAQLRKNGIRLRVSWETLVKLGNFDIIGRSTSAFARYAAEQEDVALAKQLVSTAGVVPAGIPRLAAAAGPPATLVNASLSLQALEAAIAQLGGVKIGGRPLAPTGFRLVVPTTLSQTARNILSITQVERTISGDTFTQTSNTGNVNLTVFPALESVGNFTTPGSMNTDWFLIGEGTARPALAEVFLEGYRTPLISIKDSGHFSLAGGLVPSREGSFEIDDVETRGRHIVGAALIEPTAIVYSEGDNN